jgi:hypothetical protein
MANSGEDLPTRVSARAFSSLTRYNSAFPDATMPSNMRDFDSLRRFDAGGTGVENDVTGSGGLMTIDFLRGGAPASGESDRIGVVVATHWGRAPIFVLAEGVSLWAAWLAVTRKWPTRLSDACETLGELHSYSGWS